MSCPVGNFRCKVGMTKYNPFPCFYFRKPKLFSNVGPQKFQEITRLVNDEFYSRTFKR